MTHMHKVSSSQIDSIGYDEPSLTMTVVFKDKNGDPGSEYRYHNVEPEMYDGMRSADSVGSYFYKHIKFHHDKYPFVKVVK